MTTSRLVSVVGVLAACLGCGGAEVDSDAERRTAPASYMETRALLRDVYDRFQGHEPIFLDSLDADSGFRVLKDQAKMEHLLGIYPFEPTLQPIILPVIRARRDLRTIEFLVMSMQEHKVLVHVRSGINMQVIDVQSEIGDTLSALTGAKYDPDPKAWLLWWKANASKFPKQL